MTFAEEVDKLFEDDRLRNKKLYEEKENMKELVKVCLMELEVDRRQELTDILKRVALGTSNITDAQTLLEELGL